MRWLVGSWVLLESNTAEQVNGATIEAVATTGVSRSERALTPNVTLVDREGWELLHDTARFYCLGCSTWYLRLIAEAINRKISVLSSSNKVRSQDRVYMYLCCERMR